MNLPWPPAGSGPLPIDVVSVQSQVVYGRVGNNVAVPTLAAQGLTVAAVPTVLLGNTPHYASLHGGGVPQAWFAGWLDDLVARGALARLRAVQTGYLADAAQARALAGWIRARIDANPHVRVVVDPVIGDHDVGAYVDPTLIEAFRDSLLPLADGLTPNDFELARLTGWAPTDIAGTVAAARTLLRDRTRWVAVTSAAPAAWPAGSMHLVLVSREGAWRVTHPRIDVAPKGSGDLFTAALVARWIKGVDLQDAVVQACRQVIAALRATRAAGCAELLLPGVDATVDEPVSIRTLTAPDVAARAGPPMATTDATDRRMH